MRAFYYLNRVLLYIAMVVFGFLNIIAWISLTFRLNLPASGWVLFSALLIGYFLIILFLAKKKFGAMFFSSFVFPITSVVVGLVIRSYAASSSSVNLAFFRNHVGSLSICLFAGLIWAFYSNLPEQKACRREKDYRRLKPDEKILP